MAQNILSHRKKVINIAKNVLHKWDKIIDEQYHLIRIESLIIARQLNKTN